MRQSTFLCHSLHLRTALLSFGVTVKLSLLRSCFILSILASNQAIGASIFATTGADVGSYGFYKAELGQQLVPAVAFAAGMEFSSEISSGFEHVAQIGAFGFAQNIALEQEQLGQLQTGYLSAWAGGANVSAGSRWYFTDAFSLGLLAHVDYGFLGNMQSSLGVVAFNQDVTGMLRYGARAEFRQQITQNIGGFVSLGYNQGSIETKEVSPSTFLGKTMDFRKIEFTGYQLMLGASYLL
jgi:hypothetical protein